MKRKSDYKRRLLKYKLIALFIIIGLVLDAVMLLISYMVYTADINDSYGKIGSSISQVLASYIDGDNVELWYDGRGMDSYSKVKSIVQRLYKSDSNLKNIYVCSMQPDGIRVLFNAEDTDITPGYRIDYDESWSGENRSVLINGGAVAPLLIEDGRSGREPETLLITMEPVYNSSGECVCYAVCDISMRVVYAERRDYMKSLALLIGIPSLILVVLVAIYVERRIVFPLNRIDWFLRRFVYHSNENGSARDDLLSLGNSYPGEIVSMRNGVVGLIDGVSEYAQAVGNFRDSVAKGMKAVDEAKNDTQELDETED